MRKTTLDKQKNVPQVLVGQEPRPGTAIPLQDPRGAVKFGGERFETCLAGTIHLLQFRFKTITVLPRYSHAVDADDSYAQDGARSRRTTSASSATTSSRRSSPGKVCRHQHGSNLINEAC